MEKFLFKMRREYADFKLLMRSIPSLTITIFVLSVVCANLMANKELINYKYVARRPGDVMAIWADTKLANEELGWKAERTVEETLKAAWAWECHLAGK